MNIFSLILAGGVIAGSLSAVAAVPGTGGPVVEHNIDMERMMPVRRGVKGLRTANMPSRVAAAPRPGFELRGSLLGADTWTDNISRKPYGIYSVTLSPGEPLSVNNVALDPRLDATTGAVMTPKGYYVISTTPYMGYYLVDYCLFDPSDWSLVSKSAADMESMARSLAYNPADGLIYGSFANLDGSFSFSSLDIKKGSRKKIVARMENPYCALAADESGVLYGIDAKGDLVRIESKSGDSTLLYETGLPSAYTTSAIYDKVSGVIYYVQAREEASELFAIDPSDGSVLSLGVFGGGEQWGGLYIPEAEAPDAAPGGAVSAEATFEDGSLQGIVSFIAPEFLFGGDVAEGEMEWSVTEDTRVVATGICHPGESVEAQVSVAEPGLHTFSVILKNDGGEGPVSSVTVPVGPDVPRGVESLTLSSDDEGGSIRLHWDAPREGENGGWINHAALSYDIVRYPGGEKVAEGLAATEWSEPTAGFECLTVLRYGVTAINDGIRGSETLSTPMPLGNISLPYEVDFRSPGALDAFHIIDANGDGITWTPDEKHSAYVDYSDQVMNDWLISSPVEMKKGMVYKITIDAWSQSVRHDERIALWIGQGMDVASMTKRLTMRSLDGHPAPITVPVTVEKDGLYNIGIQGCSGAGQYVLRLGSLAMAEPVAQTAPDAPRILSIAPDEQGELAVAGRILLPTKAYDGSSLTEITTFTLRRDDEEILKVENPLPGQIVTFDDQPEKEGRYAYTAMASSAAGNGVEMKSNVYVGVNIPSNPWGVLYLSKEDGGGTLTWGPVTTGADGLQLNTTDVTYHVYDQDFNELGSTTETNMDVTPPESTVSGLPLVTIYYVRAESKTGLNQSWDSSTNLVNIGPASEGVLKMPMNSILDHCLGMTVRGGVPTGKNPWSKGTDESGAVRITASATAEGESHLLVLPAVTLGEDRPALTFGLHGGTPQEITIHVLADGPQGAIMVNPAVETDDDGVGRHIVSLESYAGRTVNIILSLSSAENISITDMLVDCVRSIDVRLESLTTDSEHTHGTIVMKATVRNAGTSAVEPFTVSLFGEYDMLDYPMERDGLNLIDRAEIPAMEPGETRKLDFRVPFEQYRHSGVRAYAMIEGIGDNEPWFSQSEAVAVKWADKGLPVPRDVRASQVDGQASVEVRWDEPDGVNVVMPVIPEDHVVANEMPSLTGYKVYKDRELLAECGQYMNGILYPLPEGTLGDEDVLAEYTVVACYGDEESVPCEPVVVKLSEAEGVVAEGECMSVARSGSALLLYGAQGDVEVYTPAGLFIMRVEALQEATGAPLRLDLAGGVYIITDGKTTLRVSF